VETSGYHTCVVKLNGNVDCWGTGAGAADYLGGDAVQVSATGHRTCVRTGNGNVNCYGEGDSGENAPYTGGDAIDVATGYGMTCVVKRFTHNPYCWGYETVDWYTSGDVATIEMLDHFGNACLGKLNGSMDCGFGILTAAQASKAAIGQNHYCILTAGNVDCAFAEAWAEDYGQAADYSGGDAVDVSAGYYSTCILKSSGNVDCYGIAGGRGDYGVPPAPTGLTAKAGTGAGEIVLTWNAVEIYPPVSSYQVYRGVVSGGEVPVTTGGCANVGTATSCTDSGLGDGTTRYYRVSAVNSLDGGPPSAGASATTNTYPSSEPQNFRYDVASDLLSWDPPGGTGGSSVASYEMFVRVETLHPLGYCLGPAQPPVICSETEEAPVPATSGCADLGPDDESCVPTDCPATRRCFYAVRAVNAAGQPGEKAAEVEVLGAR
jgi:hypothetical protein